MPVAGWCAPWLKLVEMVLYFSKCLYRVVTRKRVCGTRSGGGTRSKWFRAWMSARWWRADGALWWVMASVLPGFTLRMRVSVCLRRPTLAHTSYKAIKKTLGADQPQCARRAPLGGPAATKGKKMGAVEPSRRKAKPP